MKETLSIEQARKLVLHSQRVLPAKQRGSATAATLSTIEHLGYVQIDAIAVIQRAHHHTLWNRNARYENAQLDQLVADKQVFEYWSHAAAYLPMCDYRFSLVRKQAFASGRQKHWYQRDEGMIQRVLQRIAAEGPLKAKDFDSGGKSSGEWKAKPAKRALEYLFMQGDLMVPCRDNFHKVYDLTERVLPASLDTTQPSQEEYARYLIHRYLRANGLGQPAEIAYLLKGEKPLITATLQEMVFSGELIKLCAAGNDYFALPSSLELLSKPLARSKLKILSPFDNLVIQRKRMQDLFGFDYLIECYLPEAKRQYGYFSLPVLWDGQLVGRMDCKAVKERGERCLHIHHFALERTATKTEALFHALRKELARFLLFNQCSKLQLHKTTPANIEPELRVLLADLMN